MMTMMEVVINDDNKNQDDRGNSSGDDGSDNDEDNDNVLADGKDRKIKVIIIN